MEHDHARAGFHGPRCWAVTGGAGVALGVLASWALPAQDGRVPLWLVAPFVMLLASIALMPFVSTRFWHAHFPDFSFSLGGFVAAYALVALDAREDEHALTYGQSHLLHTLIEYYAFIALVGGLYVASGGIVVRIDRGGGSGPGAGRPLVLANVAILGVGALLANLVGTTGASVVLIRPFIRLNAGRIRPAHVFFFILIVSNCGGCLTPIGDPPLYLGYLKGVPFFWTLRELWLDWALVVGLLLAVFAVVDSRIRADAPGGPPAPRVARASGSPEARWRVRVEAGRLGSGGVLLVLIVLCAFVDPLVASLLHVHGVPIGPTMQIALGVLAYRVAPRGAHEANEFSLFPVKEVALLFAGIFVTMFPALSYLSAHGGELGLTSAREFFWACGSLSAVLDNAPTYVCFLQLALQPGEVNPENVLTLIEQRPALPHAISTGAVFFGAMTYIGNGPNFMVKAIADSSGVRTHTFFGHLLRAALFLGPILLLQSILFVR